MARRPADDTTASTAARPPAAPGEEGLFGWVADFDSPAAVKAARDPRAPHDKRLPLVIGGGSLLVIAATVVAAFLRPFEAETGITASPSPAPVAAPTSTAPSEPEEPVVAGFELLPESCAGLYGPAMQREFERNDMHLNSVWTGAREQTAGSADPELLALLRAERALSCFWLDEAGGTRKAVLTVASEPGDEKLATVGARLSALGFAHQNERGGVRYFVETRHAGESKGESHFLRDGVWIATNWYGFGPWGYTGHMAENVFF